MIVPAVDGVPREEVLRELRNSVDQLQLLSIMHNISVFLLVMNEAAAVRSCPITLVALIGMFSRVSSSVVYQVVGTLELLATEVASVSELWFVDQLVLLQGVLQLERHAAVLTSKVPDV